MFQLESVVLGAKWGKCKYHRQRNTEWKSTAAWDYVNAERAEQRTRRPRSMQRTARGVRGGKLESAVDDVTEYSSP